MGKIASFCGFCFLCWNHFISFSRKISWIWFHEKIREINFTKKNREYNYTMVVYSNVEVSDFGNEEQHKWRKGGAQWSGRPPSSTASSSSSSLGSSSSSLGRFHAAFLLDLPPLPQLVVVVVVLPIVYNFEGVPTSSSSQAVVVTALAITLEIESSEKIVLETSPIHSGFCLIWKKIREINFTKNFT